MENKYKLSDDEIKHYGRKGMRWGERLFQKQFEAAKAKRAQSKETRALARAEKNATKIVRTGSNSKLKKLSDDQIQQAVYRLDLENSYKRARQESSNLRYQKSKNTDEKKQRRIDRTNAWLETARKVYDLERKKSKN